MANSLSSSLLRIWPWLYRPDTLLCVSTVMSGIDVGHNSSTSRKACGGISS